MMLPDLTRLSELHPTAYGTPLPVTLGAQGGAPAESSAIQMRWGALPEGTPVYAVGWLGDSVPSTGVVPIPCIDRLMDAHAREVLFTDGYLGSHSCEICPPERRSPSHEITWKGMSLHVRGHGQHLVQFREIVYLCPGSILHYILGHGYRPPDVFVEAVVGGRFLTPQDLILKEFDR